MALPNEITHQKSASFGLAWAMAWRMLLITIAFGFAFTFVMGWVVSTFLPAPTPYFHFSSWALYFICSVLIYWATVHWVLIRGFGSVKIVLMEHAHYQQLEAAAHGDATSNN